MPAAVALSVLAATAIPTAASAAQQPAAPEIGSLWTVNDSSNIHDGVGYVAFAAKMGIGNSAGDTSYRGERVVVSTIGGAEVCDTDDNAHQPTGGLWDCTATPATLGVGSHALRATAFAKDGTASRPSSVVTVHVTAGDTDGGAGGGTTPPDESSEVVPAPGPVDPGFGQGNDGETPLVAPPQLSATAHGTLTTVRVQTTAGWSFELLDGAGRWAAGGSTDGRGVASANIPTPAVDTKYTAVVTNYDGDRSAPGAVTVAAGAQAPAVAAPEVTTNDTGYMTVINVQTQPSWEFEIRDAAGRIAVDGGRADHTGRANRVVVTPATDTVYTVTVRDFQGQRSAPTTFTVSAPAQEGFDDSAVTVPAPGPVDAGFTVQPGDGGEDGGEDAGSAVPALTLDWARVRTAGGATTVSAALNGMTGASVVVTDSTGATHEYTPNGSGRTDVSFTLPLGSAPVFSVVQVHDGAQSAPLRVVPTRG